MTKTDLIEMVAKKSGATKKDSEVAVNAVFESIKEILAKGDKLQLIGFGTFETRTRSARQGRNPQTGQTIEIKSRKSPVFKAGQALKAIVK